MERIKAWLRREPEYEPLVDGGGTDAGEPERADHDTTPRVQTFSWTEYAIFLLLGIAMLWAWNMFLAAGPYLQTRFSTSPWIYNNFQSVELVVSSLAALGGMLVLTGSQANASYPKRIILALVINTVAFILLAVSTQEFLDISAEVYFAFIIIAVTVTSTATALFQNGIFSYVIGFGEEQYTQGIMTGQAVAGVLPCIAQIVLVLSVNTPQQHEPDGQRPGEPGPTPGGSPKHPSPDGKAAFAYFLTAFGVSAVTLVAFLYLLRQQASKKPKPIVDQSSPTDDIDTAGSSEKSVPLYILFRKTRWLALAVFATFTITMIFPVYTQQIVSVNPPDGTSQFLQPASFIPLAFLFWNSGDLVGRMITAVPFLRLTHRPRIVFVLSLLRLVFIPLYQLCNVRGRGAIVQSDLFYLVGVQLLYGMTNGYIGSLCMMGAGDCVSPDERAAAGGFMGLSLVLGLTSGSFLSFLVPRG